MEHIFKNQLTYMHKKKKKKTLCPNTCRKVLFGWLQGADVIFPDRKVVGLMITLRKKGKYIDQEKSGSAFTIGKWATQGQPS